MTPFGKRSRGHGPPPPPEMEIGGGACGGISEKRERRTTDNSVVVVVVVVDDPLPLPVLRRHGWWWCCMNTSRGVCVLYELRPVRRQTDRGVLWCGVGTRERRRFPNNPGEMTRDAGDCAESAVARDEAAVDISMGQAHRLVGP